MPKLSQNHLPDTNPLENSLLGYTSRHIYLSAFCKSMAATECYPLTKKKKDCNSH